MHPKRRVVKFLSIISVITILFALLPSIPLFDISVQASSTLSSLTDNQGGQPLSGEKEKDEQPKIKSEKVVVSVSPDEDTEINSPSEKIKLKVPKGAVTSETEIEFIEYTPPASTDMQIISLFELNAKEKHSAKAISKFNTNLEITIQHDEEDLVGIDVDSLHLYCFDEKAEQWLPVVGGQYDPKKNSIKATTDHFSTYGEFANPNIVGPGRIMASQVNLHSGTAVSSYPLELPPGSGGFQPSLILTYNSGSADEMKNKKAVGSWVGIGWSLSLGSISYAELAGQYYLDLNGASYELVSTDGINFRTNPEQYLKITRNSVDGNTWEVLDREGIYYRFGGTADSEQYIDGNNYYRWDLNLMEDTNGNEAAVTYVRDIRSNTVRSAYPEYLTYGDVEVHFTSSWDQNTTDGYVRRDNPISYTYYEVYYYQYDCSYYVPNCWEDTCMEEFWDFISGNYFWAPVPCTVCGEPFHIEQTCVDSYTISGTNPAPKVMETRKLDSIEIKVSDTLVSEYDFTYNTTNRVFSGDYGGVYYAGKHTLTSITQVGADGTSTLPAMTFTYQDLQTYRYSTTGGGVPENPASFNWPHLTAVNSGFGGDISFSYTQIPDTSAQNTWTREVVTTKTISSGIGGNETYTYEYTGTPQYLGTDWDQKYRGFGEVKETDAASNYAKHWFYTTGTINGKDAERLTGREYQTQWFNSGDTLLNEKTYDWSRTITGITDSSYTSTFGNTGTATQGNLWYPKDVAVSAYGYVYVVDNYSSGNTAYAQNCVVKFDSAGNYVSTFGNTGTATEGNLWYPKGVAVSADGYVYVVDNYSSGSTSYTQNCVVKFDSAGNYVSTFGNTGTAAEGNLWYPKGVAVSADGYVYVVDNYSSGHTAYTQNCVVKFDSAGNYISTFGNTGTAAEGNLWYPNGAAVSADGYVYVVDNYSSGSTSYTQNCVVKFDSSGNYVTTFGDTGTAAEGNLWYPNGAAVSADGYVYVVDNYSSGHTSYTQNCIVKFDSSGNYVSTFGNTGTAAEGNLYYPKGVAVPADGYVYVVDNYSSGNTAYAQNCVVKFGIVYYTVQLDRVEETIGNKTTRAEYFYDDYGNIVSEKIWGDTITPVDNAIITRTYYPNTTTNILGKVAREKVYLAVDDTFTMNEDNLKKETLYYYDENTSWETAPTDGMLTRLESKYDSSNSVSSHFTYDTYGNMLTSTDPNGNTSTFTYETTYNTYPATQTYPITGLSESYVYEPGSGNLLSVTDVNGQTTTAEYDTFKRITKLIRPGDSSASPSAEYQYNNWGTLNQQHLKTLTKVSEANYLWQSQYFDGLGRVMQVHSNEETGRTIISGATVFNNRGLAEKQYISQDLASSQVSGYYAPEAGWKYSSYVYDGLGRVTVQNYADGTSVSSDYSIPWQTNVTNPRGFIARYYNDAFGRLVKVEEPDETNGVYATTLYAYDTLGNLVQVTDDDSNVTTISYDWLGRKTSMTDPDMGTWSYGYNNNGNLISQTDALNQTITFTYDAMSRLTGKQYPGAGMADVIYTYDSGTNGKGMRTGMIDAIGSNAYTYDARGRLITETRIIDSVDYVTQFAYDGADRPTIVIYPTGETVTNAYNGTGLPYSVSGGVAGSLVTSTLYNHLGQITEINLGNGLRTTYGYWDVGGGHDTTGGYYGRLWEIKTFEPGQSTLQDMKYTWDATGNLAQRENVLAVGDLRL